MDLQIALIDGTLGCLNFVILDQDYVAANDTATVSDTVGPGTYWLFAAAQQFTGWPCPQSYKCWFNVEPGVVSFTPPQGRPPLENEFSNTAEPSR